MAQTEGSSLTVRHRFSVSSSSTTSFLTHLGLGGGCLGAGDQELDVVGLDHCYAKPWSAHPDASSARPLRMLFLPKHTRPSTLDIINRNLDPVINVVEVPPMPSMPFDVSKARNLMTECERHASYARTDSHDDWEEKISRSGWTVQQTRLFTKIMKILQCDRLARLAMESIGNEPIARRQVVDKTARRMRQALASVGWDPEVVQWLHLLILDNLSVHLLACYLDALQTLKSKVPSLVEKMISGTPPKHPSLSHEALGLLLKRPWDPVGAALTQQKLKRLPGNPLLLIAPSGPAQSGSSHTGQARRLKFWQVHLNSLGKTIPTNMSGGGGISMVLCLEQMIGALRTKVLEQKSHHPGRPIILLGWNIGALLACHVSLIESVNAVVCLGFPFTGLHGPRGDCEDPLLGSQTPTLFIIGQHACDCSVEQLQDLREHMRGETGMVVVGGADEQLRLSHRIKREEGLTQAMADRCIIDEVYQFLGSILSMNAGLPDLPPAELTPVDVRRKRKRKAKQGLLCPSMPDTHASPAASPSPSPVVGRGGLLVSGSGRGSRRGGKTSRLTTASTSITTSEGGRPGPRRRGGRGGMGGPSARKRVAVGLGPLGKAGGSRSPQSPSPLHAHSSGPALSAISSAPELSGLLQGIRITRPTEADSLMVGGRSLVGSASFPLTKVLTFSKIMEGGDVTNSTTLSGPATLLASAVRDSDKERCQQQFLVKTGGTTGTNLAFPVSMQRLISGSSPLVHITGASTSSQIQQLLTSMASTSGSSTTALLINTTAASATPTPAPHQPIRREMADPAKPDTPQILREKRDGEGGGKTLDRDMNVQASKTGDSASTAISGVVVPATMVSSLVAQKTSASESGQAVSQSGQAVSQSGQESVGTVVSLSSVPLLSSSLASKVTMVKKTSLHAAGSLGTLTQAFTIGKAPTVPQHVTAPVSQSGGELGQSAGEGVSISQPSTVLKPSLVQLAAAKSLINTGSVTTHSILRVAGTVTQAASTVASSILDGRNAVLITPALAKSLPATPTAILLSKSSTSPAMLTTAAAYKPSLEVLGKVSSVLEPGAAKGKALTQQAAQASTTVPSVASTSMVTVPVSLSKAAVLSKPSIIAKSDVISTLKATKPASPVPTQPCIPPPPPSPIPICIASPSHQNALVNTTVTPSPTAMSGGGRGGHKSGNALSYTASSKSVLPSATSTRTRKIRTPKQYDL